MSSCISPAVRAEVIAYLEAGYSKAATSRQVGISLSSVKRIACDSTVKPGKNHAELVSAASESLHRALTNDFAKRQLASLIIDDLALAAGLRDHTAALLEEIERMEVTTLKDAVAKGRVLAAIATTNKANSDGLRQVISLAAPNVEVDELPTLVVTEMTPEEVAEIRDKQDRDAAEMGITLTEEEAA